MRLLVDTHLLIWWPSGKNLPASAAGLIRDPAIQIYASAASVWEVAIKVSLGKLRIDLDEFIVALRESDFQELSVTARHVSPIFRNTITIRSTVCWSRKASRGRHSCSRKLSSSLRTGLRRLSPGRTAPRSASGGKFSTP